MAIEIIKQVSQLGSSAPAVDGVGLLVVPKTTGYTIGGSPFYSADDAVAAGITQANDTTHSIGVWRHIFDFYRNAPTGTELHVIEADSVTIAGIFDPAGDVAPALHNYLALKQGAIKMIGVVAPHGAESTPETKGVSQDLIDSFVDIQNFVDYEFEHLRPIDVVVEGRNFDGTAALLHDLRSNTAGNVSVVVGQEKAVATGAAYMAKYAAVGLLLGSIAACHVGRNVGRVKNGSLPILEGKFSNGSFGAEYSETDLINLETKGYIFLKQEMYAKGWFWNDDHTCTTAGYSNSQIALNRTLNKACRITAATYAQNLRDEVRVDPKTGLLDPLTCKSLQVELESAIKNEMVENPDPDRDKECVSVSVYINPSQNVIATSKIKASLNIVPIGIGRVFSVTVSLINPANN